MSNEWQNRLATLQERIARACESSQRDPASVTLIAVSKTHPIESIRRFYDLGVRDFSESRLQEAQPKIEVLPGDIRWHFIGHLQSNKAKKIASLFDVVHTVCKENQIAEMRKAERPVDALIEVNIAAESQKSGLLVSDVEQFAEKHLEWEQVKFRGLMTVGPISDNAADMQPYFRQLAEINRKIGGSWLSMGMSHDFEVAIQEGSTHVRVGTALFGAR